MNAVFSLNPSKNTVTLVARFTDSIPSVRSFPVEIGDVYAYKLAAKSSILAMAKVVVKGFVEIVGVPYIEYLLLDGRTGRTPVADFHHLFEPL